MKDLFIDLGLEAGFTHSQLSFLSEHFANSDHAHDVIDIHGLNDEVREQVEEIMETEDDDEEEED